MSYFKNNYHHLIILMILICYLFIGITCSSENEQLGNVTLDNNTPNNTSDDTTKGTWIEFNNLEYFPVTIYSDPSRQHIVTSVDRKSSKKIIAIPNIIGIIYYPTFSIDIPYIEKDFIFYDAPDIITVIEEDKTTKVPVPKLESIEINNSYIRIINNSDHSLSFQFGNIELSPLDGRPNIIVPNQNAVYEIIPGNVSSFSLRRNTTTPIAFPAGFNEFEAGNLYSFTFSDNNLVLSSVLSLPASSFPAIPKNLTVEIVSATSVKLTWEPVIGAVSYRVYRDSTLVTTVTTSSYTINSLAAGTNYNYSVKAFANNVEGQASEVKFSMPPSNIQMTDRANNSITISWNTVVGASGYNIYRSDTVNGVYIKLNKSVVIVNNYTDIELSEDTSYYYKVTAVVNNLQSLESIPVSISTLSNVPRNLSITAVNINSVTFKWDTLNNVSSYNIYRSDSENGVYNKINTNLITNNYYLDSGLSVNTTYYYKVTTIISDVESGYSNCIFVATLSDIPSNFRVIAMNSSRITLGWNVINGVEGYNIYRSDSENGVYSKLNTALISDNSYLDSGLTAYKTYYYKVTSTTSGTESSYSDIVSGSAGVNVPGNNLAEKLTWLKNNALSNSYYVIEVSANENLSPQDLTYSGKSNINITMNSIGNIINLSSNGILFTIGSGVTLTLNNITLNGRTNNNDSLIRINANGVLILNDGAKIAGNTNINNSSSSAHGGGVYLNGGTLVINGGQITGNSVSHSAGYYGRGGGVYIASGVFTLNTGEISGNSANGTSSSAHGGGVYIANGMFNMNGGEIRSNSCTSSSSSSSYNRAAGVYVASGSVKFRMSGGVIYGNIAPVGFANSATNGAALYSESSGIAQYGTLNNDTFYRSGDFAASVNTTVRIVGGSLLNE